MQIGQKNDYVLDDKTNRLYSNEINTIVRELYKLFTPWMLPKHTEDDQLAQGVNLFTHYTTWYLDYVDRALTLYRPYGLPIPEWLDGLSGLCVAKTDNLDMDEIRMLSKRPVKVEVNGSPIIRGLIKAGVVYHWMVSTRDGEKLLSMQSLSIQSPDEMQPARVAKLVTIEPTPIINNTIKLPSKAVGDIVLNTVHIYDHDSKLKYDTKTCEVNPDDPTEVIIGYDGDGIVIEGRLGVVTYME